MDVETETEAMRTAKLQLLRDPDIQPTEDVIANALGEAYGAYGQFINELTNHDIQIEWRYYTDGKAWLAKGLDRWTGVRGGKHETTIFWMSIWDGFFKVSFFIPEKIRAEAHSLPLADKIKLLIADSKQMGTKFKYFPLVFDLCSDEMLESVFTLVDFKIRNK